jgi:hypothetical protein
MKPIDHGKPGRHPNLIKFRSIFMNDRKWNSLKPNKHPKESDGGVKADFENFNIFNFQFLSPVQDVFVRIMKFVIEWMLSTYQKWKSFLRARITHDGSSRHIAEFQGTLTSFLFHTTLGSLSSFR